MKKYWIIFFIVIFSLVALFFIESKTVNFKTARNGQLIAITYNINGHKDVNMLVNSAKAVTNASDSSKINITGGSSITTLNDFLDRFINVFLIGFMGFGFFISTVVGGFMYLTAGAETQKAETAKKTIFYSLIGFILAVLSYALFANAAKIINNIFG